MDLYFEITGTNIVLTNPQSLVADSNRYIILHFDFKSDEWLEGEKTAYVGKYPIILNSDNICELPMLAKGNYNIGVGISKADGTLIYTNKATIRLNESIKPTSVSQVESLGVFEQIMQRIDTVSAVEVPLQVTNVLEEYFKENPIEKYDIGEGLKIEGNTLSVDTADIAEQDNTKPITSSAVYTTVGNIHALLSTI